MGGDVCFCLCMCERLSQRLGRMIFHFFFSLPLFPAGPYPSSSSFNFTFFCFFFLLLFRLAQRGTLASFLVPVKSCSIGKSRKNLRTHSKIIMYDEDHQGEEAETEKDKNEVENSDVHSYPFSPCIFLVDVRDVRLAFFSSSFSLFPSFRLMIVCSRFMLNASQAFSFVCLLSLFISFLSHFSFFSIYHSSIHSILHSFSFRLMLVCSKFMLNEFETFSTQDELQPYARGKTNKNHCTKKRKSTNQGGREEGGKDERSRWIFLIIGCSFFLKSCLGLVWFIAAFLLLLCHLSVIPFSPLPVSLFITTQALALLWMI